MTQLSAALSRTFELGDTSDLPVKASSTIYTGSAVGVVPSSTGAGYARQLTAGDIFGGFADNDAVGTAADGGVNVKVRRRGKVEITISGVAETDKGKPVYASDGNTFTLTASTNTAVGRLVRVSGTDLGIVAFDADKPFGGLITKLTDNSGGTASDTIAAVPGSYTQATLANQIASVVAKVNSMIEMGR